MLQLFALAALWLLLFFTTLDTGTSRAADAPSTVVPPGAPKRESGCTGVTPEVEAAIWKSPYYAEKQVWGYVDRHSVRPGESFNLMLATRPAVPQRKVRAEVFRVGPGADHDRQLVWRSDVVIATCREVASTASAIGPGWVPSVEIAAGDDWRSGFYTIDVVHEADGFRDLNVAYVVVRNPRRSGDILIKLGTNTYQAYNGWGGQSLYGSDLYGQRGQMVSFDRPTPPSFFEFDAYLAVWLEAVAARHGWTVGYATNFDVHADPSLMDGYDLVIVPGHDEYWTKEEFDSFERRIFQAGRNVLFLGGDIAFFQARYADVNRPPGTPDFGRQLVSFKNPKDPIRWRAPDNLGELLVTARFREDARRPETMLTGVGSEGRFTPKTDRDPSYPIRVVTTDLPFFAGSGLQVGDSVGDLAGYEWGNTDPERDGKRLWNAERSQIAPLDPHRVVVVLAARPRDDEGREGLAESVYFVSPAGAKVFSAGNIRWPWGLSKPGFESEAFRRLNENLIAYFLESPEQGG
jgi:hypothetical protein